MIDANDPVVAVEDQEDGSYKVHQASGKVIANLPPQFKSRMQAVAAKNAPAPSITPAPSTSFAPSLGLSGASNVVASSEGATGLDLPSVQKVETATQQVGEARSQAVEADVAVMEADEAAKRAVVETQNIQAQQELADLKDQQTAGQAAYDTAMSDYDAAKTREIDPAQVFKGKNLALAFAVGIAQAFSNAFKVKAGQRPNLDLIGDMVKRSIAEQTRQRAIQLGDSKEAQVQIAKEMKQRKIDMREVASRTLQRNATLATDPQRAAFYQKAAADNDVINRNQVHEDSLKTGTQVSKSTKDQQSLQAAPLKVVGADAFPRNELDAELKRNGWDRKEYVALEKEVRPLRVSDDNNKRLSQTIKALSDGQDVPGFGMVDKSNLFNYIRSDAGKQIRQEVGFKTALFMKEISGAAVSEQEREILNRLIQGTGDLTDIQRALVIMGRETSRLMEDYRGGSRGDMLRSQDGFLSRSKSQNATQSSKEARNAAAMAPASAEVAKTSTTPIKVTGTESFKAEEARKKALKAEKRKALMEKNNRIRERKNAAAGDVGGA